ncbi:hypothetical protein A33Q_1616 [Indibacter alkaliphilus LW1]|uniref:Uncharacterized protein n=1 Tax=Indibacter alkaliphilus (strain CCUG 57479 / KCTC 22604 / LW1) TaxID=1189612 RepID=S2DFB4_INDAL|nr:hypothetical protein A33Q_1616 [Indibacter alkaliphilus LW1]
MKIVRNGNMKSAAKVVFLESSFSNIGNSLFLRGSSYD